jgi:aminoglycoside/choline kinase family phosphotransferase
MLSAREQARQAWLGRVLDAPPERVEAASGDASFRSYYRVFTDGGSQILMDAPPPQEDCAPFVQVTNLLATAGINVPQIIASDLKQGFLLLSDLGDRVYLDELNSDSADALYADALDTLVRLQAHGNADSVPAYDATRLSGEMRLFVDWFLERHLGLTLDTHATSILDSAFDLLVTECLGQPQVLVHRDYHSRNLMRTGQDNPGVLDYQDAVRGPITYDLVSLLRDVYIQWPESRVEGWVDDWAGKARTAGLLNGLARSAVHRWFDLTGVQRHLKVAGIFARLWYRDGKSRYLADVPLTLDYLLSAAARHPELGALHHWLTELDVVARNRTATAALDTGEAVS